jgi:hypothetical protein
MSFANTTKHRHQLSINKQTNSKTTNAFARLLTYLRLLRPGVHVPHCTAASETIAHA